MRPIYCYERYASESGDIGYGKESYQIGYCVINARDMAEAVQAVFDRSPPAVVGRSQLLFRQPFSMTDKGGGVWHADAKYEPQEEDKKNDNDNSNVEPLAYKVNWDTSGGTAKITSSLEVVEYQGDISDSSLVIGWDGKKVNGCEQYVPKLAESVDVFYHPREVSQSRVKDWARGTGKVNNDSWLGFEPGEVLLMGCTGEETFAMKNGKATKPVPVTWKIECSENRKDIPLSETLKVAIKDGWDYLDVFYGEEVKNGITVPVPLRYKVHRIYERISFRSLTGIG